MDCLQTRATGAAARVVGPIDAAREARVPSRRVTTRCTELPRGAALREFKYAKQLRDEREILRKGEILT